MSSLLSILLLSAWPQEIISPVSLPLSLAQPTAWEGWGRQNWGRHREEQRGAGFFNRQLEAHPISQGSCTVLPSSANFYISIRVQLSHHLLQGTFLDLLVDDCCLFLQQGHQSTHCGASFSVGGSPYNFGLHRDPGCFWTRCSSYWTTRT